MPTKVDLTGVQCTFYGTWLWDGFPQWLKPLLIFVADFTARLKVAPLQRYGLLQGVA
jgi:hypothetical protein